MNEASMEALDVVSPRQAATLWHCSPNTVYRWCRAGKVKAVRHGGRWYISRVDAISIAGGIENIVVRQFGGDHDAL